MPLVQLASIIGGNPVFTAGSDVNDVLYAGYSGDQYLIGAGGYDTAYIHGNTNDYTIKAVNQSASSGAPAIDGYELVANNGSGNLYVDQSTEAEPARQSRRLWRNGRTYGLRTMPEQKSYHMNTLEGRKASAAGRRRALAEKPPRDAPRLFVVRLGAGPTLCYGWEIRKFGSIVLNRSETSFETQLLAQMAGEKALTTMSVTES